MFMAILSEESVKYFSVRQIYTLKQIESKGSHITYTSTMSPAMD